MLLVILYVFGIINTLYGEQSIGEKAHPPVCKTCKYAIKYDLSADYPYLVFFHEKSANALRKSLSRQGSPP
jgi:hypothetical protein